MGSDHITCIVNESNNINPSFIKVLMVYSVVDKQNQIYILSKQVAYMSKREAKECLCLAKLEKFEGVFDGERPSVEANEYNKLFLDSMVENKIISSYIIERQKEYEIVRKRLEIYEQK